MKRKCWRRHDALSENVALDAPTLALVVFCGQSRLPILRWLKPGFQHCFVAVQRSNLWIVCDPLAHHTDLFVIDNHTLGDLASWYRRHGFVAVETATRTAPRRVAPLRLYTCVEAVKRILGIHAPLVVTPWQLHRHLMAKNRNTVLTQPANGPYRRA
jgi:hypothetical protein